MTTPIELEYATLLALHDADQTEVKSFERISTTVALVSILSWLAGFAVFGWF
jgi:hypothetical protein